jgi:hypothetical protein
MAALDPRQRLDAEDRAALGTLGASLLVAVVALLLVCCGLLVLAAVAGLAVRLFEAVV